MRTLKGLSELRVFQILLLYNVSPLFSQNFDCFNLIIRYLILCQAIIRIKDAFDDSFILRIQAQLSIARMTSFYVDLRYFSDLLDYLCYFSVFVNSQRYMNRLIIHHCLDLFLYCIFCNSMFDLNWSSNHFSGFIHLFIWSMSKRNCCQCVLGIVWAERICLFECIVVKNFT